MASLKAPPPARHDAHPDYLTIAAVSKQFDGVTAVDAVSLRIGKGEIFALLGGSGSGKSTLLRCLAGFEQPDRGTIVLDGQSLAALPPYARPVNMMFQSYALFPHMSVAQNIAFGLKHDGLAKAAVAARVDEMLALVRLQGLGGRKPHQLSGGQQQRVALARALAKRPKLLLLDEPLGALDKQLRAQMQLELVNIIQTSGVTCVLVTHDQEEAMSMASRIALMDHGRLQQVGTPETIYERPANRFAAEFIGSVNLIEAVVVTATASALSVRSAALEAEIRIAAGDEVAVGQSVAVALRPEKLVIALDAPAQDCNKAQGVIEEIAYFGSHSVYYLRLPSGLRMSAQLANQQRQPDAAFARGQTVWLSWGEHDGVVLPA
ncbi:ABC transporter ATP-binding protein [Xanthomonas maliensis]|uniref:ABC transporter ATP-binding protein n=1 Tax=Xanthomonas maliensis TaxID=1321368 RepID=UPI0003AB088B|nr:polyamine ABC transporter ATP-binding protein [Xanthomonas maliensis]KAB7764829.1 polyamine ABC transporter ATP-binding protein [Xanthomonas maliensis]